MNTQQTQFKNHAPKPVQKIKGQETGAYWVQSERHRQLWYKVIFRPENDEISCACKGWKFGGGQLCKHMFTVLKLEAKAV